MITVHLRHFSALIKYPYKYARKARNRNRKMDHRHPIGMYSKEGESLAEIRSRLVDDVRSQELKKEVTHKDKRQTKVMATTGSACI